MSEWPMHKLGDVARVTMGQSPPGSTYNTQQIGLPFFQGKAEFGEVSPSPLKWCSQPNRIAQAGDILLSVRAPVGPTNYASTQCCIGRGLAAIRGDEQQVDQNYLGYFLKRFESDLSRRGVGSTFSAINRRDIEAIELPVPPLAEQERIVKLLDEADAIRKLRARADQRTADLIPALFHEMFGDPITNPMGWCSQRLDQVATTTSGGTPNRKVSDYFEGQHPWVKSGELYDYRVMNAEESITELGMQNSAAKLLPIGTILVAMYGATVGAVSELGIEAATNQAVCGINPNVDVDGTYLRNAIQLQTSSLLNQRIGGAQPNISQTIIRALPIPLPPQASQLTFAKRVREIHQMRARQTANNQQAGVLFQAILHGAFGVSLQHVGQ